MKGPSWLFVIIMVGASITGACLLATQAYFAACVLFGFAIEHGWFLWHYHGRYKEIVAQKNIIQTLSNEKAEVMQVHAGLLTCLSHLRNKHVELGPTLDSFYALMGSAKLDPKIQDTIKGIKKSLREVKERPGSSTDLPYSGFGKKFQHTGR